MWILYCLFAALWRHFAPLKYTFLLAFYKMFPSHSQLCRTAPIRSALESTGPGAFKDESNFQIRPLKIDLVKFEVSASKTFNFEKSCLSQKLQFWSLSPPVFSQKQYHLGSRNQSSKVVATRSQHNLKLNLSQRGRETPAPKPYMMNPDTYIIREMFVLVKIFENFICGAGNFKNVENSCLSVWSCHVGMCQGEYFSSHFELAPLYDTS